MLPRSILAEQVAAQVQTRCRSAAQDISRTRIKRDGCLYGIHSGGGRFHELLGRGVSRFFCSVASTVSLDGVNEESGIIFSSLSDGRIRCNTDCLVKAVDRGASESDVERKRPRREPTHQSGRFLRTTVGTEKRGVNSQNGGISSIHCCGFLRDSDRRLKLAGTSFRGGPSGKISIPALQI